MTESDPLPAAITTVASTDPQINTRVQRLIHVSLSYAERVMASGDPNAKLGVLKSLIPALVKTLDKGEDRDEVIEQLRAEMSEMYTFIREQNTSNLTSAPVPALTPPVDRAPGDKVVEMKRVSGQYSKPRPL